jgi:hypothetical protein
MLAEVIIRQLEKLQEILDRCKAMTKLTEAQLIFFKASHQNQGKMLELFSSSSLDLSRANSDANNSQVFFCCIGEIRSFDLFEVHFLETLLTFFNLVQTLQSL